jgi:hypothetical protein
LGSEGKHSCPRLGSGHVRVVVDWQAGSDLHRGLAEGQRQHRRGGEFPAGRLAAVLPGAGSEMLDEGSQAVQQLGGIGDLSGGAVYHGARVVQGGVKSRAGLDHPVQTGDRDADRCSLRGR